ncbi:hypothetical protein CRG98_011228 [Punica granatum]|uniref:Uncharacterized protein n=1 Tax=Punica granatum TaxID=22663 RepID=A0A2I0KJ22_PUNGR|nr:hypothetical protein CRG98_011228 [Punica granatum]
MAFILILWSVLFPLTSILMFLALFLMKVPHVVIGFWISVNVYALTLVFLLGIPVQKQMLSYLLREPRSGHLKLLRFILKYGVPICCGLTIAFKGAESVVSATVVSAWIAYVVICRHWIAHGILDATQCFATEVFMWITQFSVDTYYSSRFDFSRMLLVFFTFLAVIASCCGCVRIPNFL